MMTQIDEVAGEGGVRADNRHTKPWDMGLATPGRGVSNSAAQGASQLGKNLNEYAEVVDGVGPHLRAGCHGGQDLQVHARSVSRC